MDTKAHIRELLLNRHSKSTTDQVILFIGDDAAKFKALVQLVEKDPDPVVRQRAAWPLSYICIENQHLVTPHWKCFVKILVDPATTGPVKRNLTRFMQEVPVPEKYQGEVTNRCFELVNDPREDIAIKAFSLSILEKMVKLYPELAPELVHSIEEQLPHASTAFKNRGGKILAKLNKAPK